MAGRDLSFDDRACRRFPVRRYDTHTGRHPVGNSSRRSPGNRV